MNQRQVRVWHLSGRVHRKSRIFGLLERAINCPTTNGLATDFNTRLNQDFLDFWDLQDWNCIDTGVRLGNRTYRDVGRIVQIMDSGVQFLT